LKLFELRVVVKWTQENEVASGKKESTQMIEDKPIPEAVE
jgi:hypothetical protein